jgi:bifunctional UDP-N-acetylglucosamine pyrophosphorylase/glucosamine-1-phosphate N-acetyltransferase
MKSAIILAAGEGRRAWPFCGIRQKVTMPVANVPMVRRLFQDLESLGFTEIAVVVGHRAGAVRDCLTGCGSVRFVTQTSLDGTASAALTGLRAVDAESVLVCYGDVVTTRENLKRVAGAFDSRHAGAVVLGAPWTPGLSQWVSLETARDGLVTGVWARGGKEHPRFAGVAAARTEPLRRCLEGDPGMMLNVGVGAMPPLEGEFAYSLDLMRREGLDVLCVKAPDFVVDADRPWDIVEANRSVLRDTLDRLEITHVAPGAVIDEGADIRDDAKLWLEPGARIGKGAIIRGAAWLGARAQVTDGAILGANVMVGEETRVEEYAKVSDHSVLGPRGVLSHCAEFTGVTLDVVYLYHYCCVTGLLGSHVDVGAATVCGTWRFDDGVRRQVVAGHSETPAAHGYFTYIGDYSRTGVGVVFAPGVKVGYNCCVGPGVILTTDLAERQVVLAQQEQVVKAWGPEKYGW